MGIGDLTQGFPWRLLQNALITFAQNHGDAEINLRALHGMGVQLLTVMPNTFLTDQNSILSLEKNQ